MVVFFPCQDCQQSRLVLNRDVFGLARRWMAVVGGVSTLGCECRIYQATLSVVTRCVALFDFVSRG